MDEGKKAVLNREKQRRADVKSNTPNIKIKSKGQNWS